MFYLNFSKAVDRTEGLIVLIPLSGNLSTNCLADSDLSSGTVSSLGISCVGDYQEYLENANQCNDNTKFMTYSTNSGTVCSCKIFYLI